MAKYNPCGFARCVRLGKLIPILILPDTDPSKKPIEMELEIKVCLKHANGPVESFVSHEGWGAILAIFDEMKLARPDRRKIYLKFQTIVGRVLTKANRQNEKDH